MFNTWCKENYVIWMKLGAFDFRIGIVTTLIILPVCTESDRHGLHNYKLLLMIRPEGYSLYEGYHIFSAIPPFFRSLENLYSFDPYILAKMRKIPKNSKKRDLKSQQFGANPVASSFVILIQEIHLIQYQILICIYLHISILYKTMSVFS